MPWPPVEEAVEIKDEDAVTGPQNPIMDIYNHNAVPVDKVHVESDSQALSDSSVNDEDKESRFSEQEIETEEYAMSQEVEQVEQVPELPQSNMIFGGV